MIIKAPINRKRSVVRIGERDFGLCAFFLFYLYYLFHMIKYSPFTYLFQDKHEISQIENLRRLEKGRMICYCMCKLTDQLRTLRFYDPPQPREFL